jgi:hypothetical protein
MSHLAPGLAIDGIRQFFKLHASCGGACYDTPELPAGGYRAVAACRCGDTVEFWLVDPALPPRDLIEEALAARIEAAPSFAVTPPTVNPRAA